MLFFKSRKDNYTQSRSRNGYEREAAIRQLLTERHYEDSKVLECLLISLGDYVQEISCLVPEACARNEELYKLLEQFSEANPQIYTLAHDRTISYWDAYYRNTWRSYEDYPPYKLLAPMTIAKP